MADVKIPVSASVQGVTNELDKIPAKVDAVSRKINKFKWQVIDLKSVEADFKKLEAMVADFHKKTGGLGLGVGSGGGPGAPGNAPGPLYRPPAGPPSGTHPAAHNSRRGGPGAYTHAPQWWDAGRNFVSGFGGGFGQIGGYGVRGGLAGYNSGGMPGAGIGMLKGIGIGALAYGAFKVGQGINEGHEMAKERLGSLDTIKRQMGDLGVSFARLKVMSDAAADGMQMNALEAAKLMERYTRESRGADRTPEALMSSVRTSAGVAKAYGLDAGAGIGFFGGMRNIDPKQNNRELALILGETIERSGMNARADEVMQVVQSFAATTSRMSLSAPNVSAHAGAYSSLMSSRLPGMTSDVAAGILNQANSSLMGMGGAGEAGQNFILAAMQRNGGLNPIQAKALAAGGLFGSRASVFGKDSALGRYFGDGATSLASGDGANVTNFDAIRKHLDGMGGDKWLQLEGAQRLYGLSSPQQAAALLNMNSSEFGGLQKTLERAGVGLNSYNEKGIQTLSKIGAARSMKDLGGIFSDMKGRTGKGALTKDELGALTSAQSTGDTEKFRDALIKIASTKDYEETQFTVMKEQQSTLEQIQINTGDKLIGPIQSIRDGINALVGKLAPDSEYMKQKKQEQALSDGQAAIKGYDDKIAQYDAQTAALRAKVPEWRQGAFDEMRSIGRGRLLGQQKMLQGNLGLASTRGNRNNNPGNIEDSGVKWQGQTGSDGRFATFDTPENGYRALGKNLLAYQNKHGLNTVRGLVSRWAPPGENNTSAYISSLAKEMGVGPDEPLDLNQKSTLEKLMTGISRKENGGLLHSPEVISAGADMALSSTPLPPGTSTAGSGRGFVNPSPVEVPLILLPQNQQGQPVGQAATARVSIPRGAGTAR